MACGKCGSDLKEEVVTERRPDFEEFDDKGKPSRKEIGYTLYGHYNCAECGTYLDTFIKGYTL
jgi:uncharacterized Zn finger protein